MVKNIALMVGMLLSAQSVLVAKATQDRDYNEIEIIELLRQADEQNDLLKTLTEKKEVDLSDLSLDEIKQTISKLDVFKEKLIRMEQKNKNWTTQDQQYLILVQELIRQLTNARIACEQRVSKVDSIKKIAIPIGTAVAVAGGLILLDMFTDFEVDTSTALLCGLVTGASVGLLTYKNDVSDGVQVIQDSVSNVWQSRSVGSIGKVAMYVSGAAAVGSALWVKRDEIGHMFGVKSKHKSLQEVAEEQL